MNYHTLKLLQLANLTGAPVGEGTSGSERKQPKVHWLKAVTARATSMPRIPAETEGNQHNRLQLGVAIVTSQSEIRTKSDKFRS